MCLLQRKAAVYNQLFTSMMSEPLEIPRRPKEGLPLPPLCPASKSPQYSPLSPQSLNLDVSIPSPIITRRTRTYSLSERAAANPVETGKVKYFCRHKGHGFITPDSGSVDLFLHISDVEGEFVPRPGDEVSYKLCPVPPKNERLQAIHVKISNMAPGTHERWDTPSPLGDKHSPIFLDH